MLQSGAAFPSAARPPLRRPTPHVGGASNHLLPPSSYSGNLPPYPLRIRPFASLSTRLSFSPRRPTIAETAPDRSAVAKSAAGDAAAAAEDHEVVLVDVLPGSSSTSGLAYKLQLGSLFALWYLFNILFNIYDKQVLEVYPFPMTITTFHFGIGALFTLLMLITNLYKRPKLSSKELIAILPLAIVHALANLFTNMSLGKVAVSFTHTIKAVEPFFTVILSFFFLGELPTISVLVSLVPIVGGVALASLTEVSFNWAGFWSAMASNLTNQSRNVLSKKIMNKNEDSVDNITLFSIITLMSFFLLAPVTLCVEGIKFTPAYMQFAGLNFKEIFVRSLIAGVCFHAYQQLAYMILARVSPVTHSVGNCVKRVVVIIASVIFFSTPVSPINSIGTGVALLGVFLYSRAKTVKHKSA